MHERQPPHSRWTPRPAPTTLRRHRAALHTDRVRKLHTDGTTHTCLFEPATFRRPPLVSPCQCAGTPLPMRKVALHSQVERPHRTPRPSRRHSAIASCTRASNHELVNIRGTHLRIRNTIVDSELGQASSSEARSSTIPSSQGPGVPSPHKSIPCTVDMGPHHVTAGSPGRPLALSACSNRQWRSPHRHATGSHVKGSGNNVHRLPPRWFPGNGGTLPHIPHEHRPRAQTRSSLAGWIVSTRDVP
jgi:hypothetical protein